MPYIQDCLHNCQSARSVKKSFSVWITAIAAVLAFLLLGSAVAADDMKSSSMPGANGSAKAGAKSSTAAGDMADDMSGDKASTKSGKASAKSKTGAKSKSKAKSSAKSGATKDERAACNSPDQDRAACLRELGAARYEAKRGGLTDPESELRQNALRRCDVFTAADEKQACVRRITGEGTVSGSVESGGVLRETTTTVPAPSSGSGSVTQSGAQRTVPSGAAQPGMTQPMAPGAAPARGSIR